MTVEERARITEYLFEKIREVAREKGAAYSGAVDSLANFKRNAEAAGLTPYQIWLVYAAKHWDCITNAIKQTPSSPVDKTESLSGRIMDMMTYLILLQCLLLEQEQTTNETDQLLLGI